MGYVSTDAFMCVGYHEISGIRTDSEWLVQLRTERWNAGAPTSLLLESSAMGLPSMCQQNV